MGITLQRGYKQIVCALMGNTAFGGILFVMVILNVKMDQGTHLAFHSATKVSNIFMVFFKKYRLFKSAFISGQVFLENCHLRSMFMKEMLN